MKNVRRAKDGQDTEGDPVDSWYMLVEEPRRQRSSRRAGEAHPRRGSTINDGEGDRRTGHGITGVPFAEAPTFLQI